MMDQSRGVDFKTGNTLYGIDDYGANERSKQTIQHQDVPEEDPKPWMRQQREDHIKNKIKNVYKKVEIKAKEKLTVKNMTLEEDGLVRSEDYVGSAATIQSTQQLREDHSHEI